MEQFNDQYELENARYQTTADEIAPYKNITTKHTFHINQKLSNNLNHEAIQMNLIGHPQKMVLTKHQLKPKDRRTDIALYDTRNQYGLNAQNVLGNRLVRALQDKQVENITLRYGPETLPLKQPTTPFPGYDTNTNTNAPMTDERLARMPWTKERQVMGESDRIRVAQALRDSPAIKERNQRQAEASKAFKKLGPAQFGLGRIGDEAIPATIDNPEQVERYRKHKEDISLYHEDYTGTVPLTTEPDVSHRARMKEQFKKQVFTDPELLYEGKELLYDYNTIVNRGKHKQSKRNVKLDEIANEFLRQHVSDYDFLIKEYEKQHSPFKQKAVFTEPTEIDVPYSELQNLDREQSIRLLKNKGIVTEYNNEDVQMVQMDIETTNGNIPMRLFATKAKEYLSLIQDSNLNYDNEIDIVHIPIATLPTEIREKVNKSKSRTVSLNFDDWNELLDISYNGRFEHDRVKKEDLLKRIADTEIVNRIMNGFDQDIPILTDSRTIQTLERPKEKRILKTAKDFTKQEHTMSYEAVPQEQYMSSRQVKGTRGLIRNASLWKSRM